MLAPRELDIYEKNCYSVRLKKLSPKTLVFTLHSDTFRHLYDMSSIYTLNVRVQNTSMDDMKRFVEKCLLSSEFHHAVTINPDLIMVAQKDAAFLQTLNNADFSTVDGIGAYLPFLLKGEIPKGRVSGSDFIDFLLSRSEHHKKPVFLLVNDSGLSSFTEIKNAIHNVFPTLEISGIAVSPHSQTSLQDALEEASKYPVVISNFGGRYQEISLAKLRRMTGNASRIAVGIGGAFDFLTGKQKRAPFLVRKFGFEWLWRLLLQPQRRLKRTWNYVVIYSLLCFKEAFFEWILFGKHWTRSLVLKTSKKTPLLPGKHNS